MKGVDRLPLGGTHREEPETLKETKTSIEKITGPGSVAERNEPFSSTWGFLPLGCQRPYSIPDYKRGKVRETNKVKGWEGLSRYGPSDSFRLSDPTYEPTLGVSLRDKKDRQVFPPS